MHAPLPLQQIIQLQLDAALTTLPFPLHFHPLQEEGVIYDGKRMSVSCFKVNHRIDCWGFLFREKRNSRSILPQRVKAYEIPMAYYESLQQGKDYITKKGTIIPNEEVTTAATPAKSYAYCADTIYDESLATKVHAVDLLYHEATYLKDLEQRAAERYHSTSVQAASIAQLAGVKKLLIGHFSSKYELLEPFLEESCTVFPNTELALEGVTFII